METPDRPNKPMDNKIPEPIPPNSWPEELSGVLEDMQGNPINVHRLMANNPVLLNAWWPFRNHSVNGGTLGRRKAELLILRVAVQTQSWYEWACHVDRALKIGIEIEHIFALLKPVSEASWAEEDRALILAVDELTANHQINLAHQMLQTRQTHLFQHHSPSLKKSCQLKSLLLFLFRALQKPKIRTILGFYLF